VAVLAALLLAATSGMAAPEAHILRIDPRASQVDGAPVLTTVMELMQNRRLSDVIGPCMAETGNRYHDCVAQKLDATPLYQTFEFPEGNAILTVTVDGTDTPARFLSKQRWSEAAGQPGIGTAWLILVDAASSMGSRFSEAKAVAAAFVNAMGPQDIVDVVFFNDRGVVQDSHWLANKQQAAGVVASAGGPYPTQGRTRPLGNILKQAATDGFKDLGNAGSLQPPMHQAMVVLSNGVAGADVSSNAAFATILREYLTKGRFPEDNQVLPKMPVPVISIWFPTQQIEELGANAREFMEGLPNPEIGGYYNIVREGGAGRAATIVNAVRTRFAKTYIIKWRVSCVAPSITQTFKLFFSNTNPPIAGDATFQNVPVGIDPTMWPLDVDRDATERAAKSDPIYPGGSLKIFGNFCWGGSASRAELYMLPANQAAPASLQGGNIDDARKAQQTLIQAGMRGKATTAGDSVVEFDLPNSEKWLSGKGDAQTARLVIYDNAAKRTSAVTADKIITLRARSAPPPYLMIAALTFGGVVVVLLIVSIARGGGGGKSRRAATPAAPPPRPIVAGAGPGYGSPIGGPPAPAEFSYGGAPMGGMPAPSNVSRATLSGQAGIFTVMPGVEMFAGRDGAVCQILLTEPRVSGRHASVKIEGGQLLVRDEGSNNGTQLNGQRLPGQTWTPVPQGASLRFGPVEFSVHLD
jgi:hypothetical protein